MPRAQDLSEGAPVGQEAPGPAAESFRGNLFVEPPAGQGVVRGPLPGRGQPRRERPRRDDQEARGRDRRSHRHDAQ